jgi:CDP-diglyceride synthetase
MSGTLLLAFHITVALALTITVGVQSSELARLRHGLRTAPRMGSLRAALWSTPLLAALTLVTGVLVVADGGNRGPWLAAGLLSTLVIGLASVWLLRGLRRPANGQSGVFAAVQWGVPAVTLAAAFLMADKPQNAVIASAPMLLAAVVTIVAYRLGARASAT